MWIVNIALRRPYTFLVMALLILLSMPYVLKKMSVDIFPDIDIPVVAMLYSYNGLPAPEIYSRISRNAERAMTQSVDNIEHTESLSVAGASIIKVFFQPGTDIGTALAQVQSAANSAYRSMPVGIAPPQVVQYSATDLPLLQIGVSSATVPETEVGELTNDVVRNNLRTKKGVELTAPFGARNRQISVDIDTAALLARGITPADVSEAIGNQTLTLPTGTIKIGEREYDVALNGSVATIAKIGDIPIKTLAGKTIHVRDVASVRDGAGPLQTIVRQNGERGILTSVFKVGGVSTLEVVDQVRAEIPRILDKLPEDMNLTLMFDQSLFVRAAIGNVLHEALIAASLTAAMILLFLGNWRSTCIIAVSIPLSICCSLIVLYLLGESLNLMTLGGLALAVGILVDDATVEIENIERQMGLGKNPHQAILDGAQEIAVPAFVSTLCICIVFVPMFFLTGVARSLFVPLAEAVVFAMLASYVLSRTLVPTLVMYMMASQHGVHRPAPATGFAAVCHRIHVGFESGFSRLREHYTVLLATLLRQRRRFGSAFAGFCLLSLGLVPLLGQDLFPAVDAGQLRLHVRAPSGTRLEEMPHLADRIEATIRETIPASDLGDILDIVGGPYSTRNTLFGNSGTTETADTEIMVSLKPGHAPSSDYVARLRTLLPERFPGVEFFFQPADQVSQTLNFGTPAPIDIQFIGGKPADVIPLTVELNNRLRAIPGIVDAHVYQRWSKPALALDMDRVRLQQLGLAAKDVAQNVMVSLSGSMQAAPAYWLNPANNNLYTIGVRTPETALDSLDSLLRTPVGAGEDGAQLLGNVVGLSRQALAPMITSFNTNPIFNIYANVEGRDLGSVSRDIATVLADIRTRLPRGVDLIMRGQVETLHDAFTGLAIGLAVAIVLVYLLLVVNFQSWIDPLIIVSALPAALAGIVWLLFLSGTTLSVPALTGTIMTMGVATANSILLVSFARTRLAEGVPPLGAALEAASTRLRPVLMTAFAMIVGMLPMALGFGEGAEQNAPLGRAVIGGLAFATASTLLFVPLVFAAVHLRLERRGPRHHLAPA
ncbi:efflux RND transporter permease subunit [Zoogloea sp. LCSB751]|uniref:efflux RND transporter permease subunit n=1 Tax=Zoogloea sp. LCSB751 TaxID=1965277 RepID=UPI0009A52B10|nr:efflux RND transporter permease subunit [Zoogloea sp. LCSB751]